MHLTFRFSFNLGLKLFKINRKKIKSPSSTLYNSAATVQNYK